MAAMRIFDSLARDLRFAFRLMRQTPVVSGVAMLSLALGIGANVAIFSLVNALMLKTLPIHEPDRLVDPAVPPTDPDAAAQRVVHQSAVGIHPRSPGLFRRRARDRQTRASISTPAARRGRCRACTSTAGSSTCSASRRIIGRTFTVDDDGAAAARMVRSRSSATGSGSASTAAIAASSAGHPARRPRLHGHRRHAAGVLRRRGRPHLRRRRAARHRADHPRRRELARSAAARGGCACSRGWRRARPSSRRTRASRPSIPAFARPRCRRTGGRRIRRPTSPSR